MPHIFAGERKLSYTQAGYSNQIETGLGLKMTKGLVFREKLEEKK